MTKKKETLQPLMLPALEHLLEINEALTDFKSTVDTAIEKYEEWSDYSYKLSIILALHG